MCEYHGGYLWQPSDPGAPSFTVGARFQENYAGLELQGERQRLLKEALRARMLARIGIRRTRTASIRAIPED